MDLPVRTLVKALTWQALGFVSMTLIGYLFTGSLQQGSGIALAACLAGFVAYLLHERLWNAVRWGRREV